MMADAFKDAMEQALAWMAIYGGLGERSITLTVNKDFGVTMMTAQEVTAMLAAVNTGQMPRNVFVAEMARRAGLSRLTPMLRHTLTILRQTRRIWA